jgi:glucose/mannose transport system substrate-binding protein
MVSITTMPTTIDQLLADLEALRNKGITAPLAAGKDWTQLMLFEVVLISDLGPDKFKGLWTGTTDWNSSELLKPIDHYRRLLSYSNQDRDTFDWTDAEQLLIENKAAFQVMGDWEAADLDMKGFKDYGYLVFPGNGDAFQWLADAFVLPIEAKNVAGTKCWLQTVGSAEGQKAFNTRKGSIPARADADPADYPPYQRSAIADWKTGNPVPSCAHGSACPQGLQGTVNAALGKFSADGDPGSLQSALSAGVAQFVVKK